ncbi:MAG: AraC family transcriptional regulator [Oscillospiraceae bacterium]|nr:AraC family transcriptional regulator [Oscillospiraceae bacterium]
MDDIQAIKAYILYLKQTCGLSVTLHPNGADTLITPSELITFNIHENSYCVYVKSHPEAQEHCIRRQYKVEQKAACGSFAGICYAGVQEYVYPLTDGRRSTGFLCVSGYKCSRPESYIRAAAGAYGLPPERLRDVYASLKDEMPPKETVDTLITPLCRMLELACRKREDAPAGDEQFVDRVVRFLKQYHTRSISEEDICRHFGCSRSYLSRQFNRQTGKSIREYLTGLRMADARSLLLYSGLTVTEVALSVGYSDSNYFSSLFKKETGLSPRSYRILYRGK